MQTPYLLKNPIFDTLKAEPAVSVESETVRMICAIADDPTLSPEELILEIDARSVALARKARTN